MIVMGLYCPSFTLKRKSKINCYCCAFDFYGGEKNESRFISMITVLHLTIKFCDKIL